MQVLQIVQGNNQRPKVQQHDEQRERQRVSNDEQEGSNDEEEHNPFYDDSSSSDREPSGRRPGARNRDRDLNFKIEITEFEGKLQPDDFIDWLNMVEFSNSKMSQTRNE